MTRVTALALPPRFDERSLTRCTVLLCLALHMGTAQAALPDGNDIRLKPLEAKPAIVDDRAGSDHVNLRVDDSPPVDPFAYRGVSSGFGPRYDPLRGVVRMHAGIDLPGVAGTPIYAAQDGIVSSAGYAGGYGLLVKLYHGGDAETRYAHLSNIVVRTGDMVSRGDVIAFLGATGHATGPHLHFEVRMQGHPINPASFLAGQWRTASTNSWRTPTPTEPFVSDFAKSQHAAAESRGLGGSGLITSSK